MEDDMSKFVTIVVLNDGETFTDVTGCSICIIPLEDYERVVQDGGDAKDFNPVVELSLDSVIIPTEEE
jgi:hypothetical protein